jgi:hypothetical protein
MSQRYVLPVVEMISSEHVGAIGLVVATTTSKHWKIESITKQDFCIETPKEEELENASSIQVRGSYAKLKEYWDCNTEKALFIKENQKPPAEVAAAFSQAWLEAADEYDPAVTLLSRDAELDYGSIASFLESYQKPDQLPFNYSSAKLPRSTLETDVFTWVFELEELLQSYHKIKDIDTTKPSGEAEKRFIQVLLAKNLLAEIELELRYEILEMVKKIAKDAVSAIQEARSTSPESPLKPPVKLYVIPWVDEYDPLVDSHVSLVSLVAGDECGVTRFKKDWATRDISSLISPKDITLDENTKSTQPVPTISVTPLAGDMYQGFISAFDTLTDFGVDETQIVLVSEDPKMHYGALTLHLKKYCNRAALRYTTDGTYRPINDLINVCKLLKIDQIISDSLSSVLECPSCASSGSTHAEYHYLVYLVSEIVLRAIKEQFGGRIKGLAEEIIARDVLAQ